MPVRKRRVALTMETGVRTATAAVRSVSVENRRAIEWVNRPGEFRTNPANRLIVALARHFGVTLATADQRILDYPNVEAIW